MEPFNIGLENSRPEGCDKLIDGSHYLHVFKGAAGASVSGGARSVVHRTCCS
jgi:hypothetical protein